MNTNYTAFYSGKIHKIQEMRLLQAISEDGVCLSVEPKQLRKFDFLCHFFGLKIREMTASDFEIRKYISLDHRHPSTALGDIKRALIFPRSIVEKCGSMWGEPREVRVCFPGLVTSARFVLLDQWVQKNYEGEKMKLLSPDSFTSRLRSKLLDAFSISNESSQTVGELYLWSSNRGRSFPRKAWDEDYYNLLSKSQFVLCPSGDYKWSYRFFESIMCGAIPIVEEGCESYCGFNYHTFDDPASDLVWSEDKALQNISLFYERAMVPAGKLGEEIATLAAAN